MSLKLDREILNFIEFANTKIFFNAGISLSYIKKFKLETDREEYNMFVELMLDNETYLSLLMLSVVQN